MKPFDINEALKDDMLVATTRGQIVTDWHYFNSVDRKYEKCVAASINGTVRMFWSNGKFKNDMSDSNIDLYVVNKSEYTPEQLKSYNIE